MLIEGNLRVNGTLWPLYECLFTFLAPEKSAKTVFAPEMLKFDQCVWVAKKVGW
jgi:hypothetical protein